MVNALKPFAVGALLEAIPTTNLRRGQVGTIVEELGASVYEVDFSDNEGRTHATASVEATKLLLLRYTPATA